MIKKYILKSVKSPGTVVFGYEDGWLTLFHNEMEMDPAAKQWCAEHLPLHEARIDDLRRVVKGSIEAVPVDVSFDAFWEAYGKKINKKRCEPLWEKMTEGDRIMAIMTVKSYDGFLKRNPGRPKLDPENYLKDECYKNPYNQL